MRITRSTLFLALTISSFAIMAADKIVATVNGAKIAEQTIDTFAEQTMGQHKMSAEQRQQIIEQLVNRELVYQDAVKQGLDKDPRVKAMIDDAVKNVVFGYRLRKLLEDKPVSKAQMKAIYNEQVVKSSSQEYKARHILLKTEEDAKKVIAELGKGSDFSELAKKHSTGPSGPKGGDLGWFTANQMVKPFADATAKLKPKSYTKRPVQTQFGWHVILLEDVREVKPPTFETMENQLRSVAQREAVSNYLEELKESAKIKIN